MTYRQNMVAPAVGNNKRRVPEGVKMSNLKPSEIVKELDSKDRKEKVNDIEVKEFQDFLLQGPVMSDEQYSEFKELRKEFSKWLEN